MEFGDCLVGVKNEDCEGNALKVILEFILGIFNFFTSNRMFYVILVCAENGISLLQSFWVVMCCNA